jgi:hypothetical protein
MSIGMEGCGPNPRVYSKAEYDTLAADNQRLREDAARFDTIVSLKLSVDVRKLFVVVEGCTFNKDRKPVVRHCADTPEQRLIACREAIDAALAGSKEKSE